MDRLARKARGGPTSSACRVRPSGDTATMASANEDAVRGFADAITSVDVEAALAVCDPEIEFISVLGISGHAYIGHEGIRQYFDDVSSAWEEWRVEVHGVTQGPDGRVAIEMTMHVRGLGSGAALSEYAGHVWTVRNGKLLRNELHRTPGEALAAVGAAL
jgi:ketosteroid isomerase-like protein